MLKHVIIVFCAFHIAAVGIVSIPFNAPDPVSTTIRRLGRPLVDPYLFATSQWQRWWVFVRERPPSDEVFIAEGRRGSKVLFSKMIPADIVAPRSNIAERRRILISLCDLKQQPATTHLYRRQHLGMDSWVPARSNIFNEQGWDRSLMEVSCQK